MKNYDRHHAKLLKHLSNNLICPKCNKKVNKINKEFYRNNFYIKAKKLTCNCQKLFIIGDIYDKNKTTIVFGENNIRIQYFNVLNYYYYYYFRYFLTQKYETAIVDLNNKDLFPINSFTNFNLISNTLKKVIKVLYKIENNMLFC